jgi:pyruvate carboxylase subunit B
MADLEKNLQSLNKWLDKNGEDPMTQDELLIKLFNEVKYTWPKVGYPPLVTPFSQYVKNLSLMNVIQTIKGKKRYSMVDENTWGMILGKSGSLPGQVEEEIKALAKDQGREFFEGNPQDLYPDVLDEFRSRMKEKSWDTGQDDEELFEYAMHPEQYEDYKSGDARRKFLDDLEQRRNAQNNTSADAPPHAQQNGHAAPKDLVVEVDGQKYGVRISYPSDKEETFNAEKLKVQNEGAPSNKTINSPLEGKFFLTKNSSEKAIAIGDKVTKGDTVAYVESMKVLNAITANQDGTVDKILVNHGDDIDEDTPLIALS